MSPLRKIAAIGTGFMCGVVGRRQVVRTSRFILNHARLDVPNDPESNGEYLLQRWTLSQAASGSPIHVIDAGANVGEWSAAMLRAAEEEGLANDLWLHAFEPSAYTFDRLSERIRAQRARLNRLALSDQAGESVLHIAAPAAGINSLHRLPGISDNGVTETVSATTLDDYAEHEGIPYFALVKIDTEGNDVAVLKGARSLFNGQRIALTQFEYNSRWIYARCFLRDAFDFLGPLGYRIGKLTRNGVEFYPAWDADLETFIEGNYVACTETAATCLPSIEWWKKPTSA